MDITALENELKAGKLNNIYLLYGEERFLLDNNVKKIKKLFGETVNGINYIQIDNTNVSEIIAERLRLDIHKSLLLQKIQDYSKSLKEEKALQLKKKHQKKMTINLRIS